MKQVPLVDIGQAVEEEDEQGQFVDIEGEGATGLFVEILQQTDQNEIAQESEKPNREIAHHRRRGKLPLRLLEKVP
jgi:hypothetical protein